MPVILATQEAEIKKIEVRSQFITPYLKNTQHTHTHTQKVLGEWPKW
jgi:hypothetical protein